MSSKSVRRAVRAAVVSGSLAIAVVSGATSVVAGTGEDVIAVNVDQAKLVKMPPRIATLVVGNPLIADVSLQPGGVVVVTGKGYGATNVIAMDRAGEILVDRIIQVEGPTDQVVTVYRGIDRESYSCMPICQRRVTLGDGEGYFKSVIEQAGSFNDKATGASSPAAKPN
jgi:Flp pilus assembly secretin CpaC